MNKSIQIILLATLATGLTGCIGPDDYTPEEGMSPAEIFSATCQTCHGIKGEGKFGFLFGIAGSEKSMQDIAKKIGEGSMLMPSFPNISAENKLSIAAYVKALGRG